MGSHSDGLGRQALNQPLKLINDSFAKYLEFIRKRASIEVNTVDYRRLRLQVYYVPPLALAWWAIIALAFMTGFDDPLIHGVNAFGASVTTISVVVLYLSASYRAGAITFIAGVYLSLISSVALTATIFAPAMMVLPFVTVVANFFVGRKGGIVVTTLLIGAVIAISILSRQGILYTSSVNLDSMFVMSAVVACFAIFVTYRLTRAATTLQNRQIEVTQKAMELAEISAVERTRFLDYMGHELRTPLQGIMGMSDLLCRDDLEGQQLQHLKIIYQSSKTLLRLINETLEHSRLESKMVELDISEFDLCLLIDETIELLSNTTNVDSLEIRFSHLENTPKWFLGDRYRIQQVLTNLLSNAIKFTDSGLIQIRYHVEKEEGGAETLHLAVADSGKGIPIDQQDKLFEPYAQTDKSDSRLHGGSGLGLSITRQLVELMGGEISFSSVPGGGTEFLVAMDCPPVRAKHGTRFQQSRNQMSLTG